MSIFGSQTIGEMLVRVGAVVDERQIKNQVRTGFTGGVKGALHGTSAGSLLKGAGILTVGTLVGEKIAEEIHRSVEEATRAQRIQDVLRNSLAATGQEWSRYGEFIHQAIEAQSELSAFEDEELFESFSRLQRRTGDVSKSLQLLALSEDIARGSGRDLTTVVNAVGRASDGQTAALTRLGIQVKKGESGVEALNQASRKYAGAAQAYGDSAAGSFDKLKKNLDDTRELVGGPLSQALGSFARDASAGLSFVNEGIEKLKKTADEHPKQTGLLESIAKNAVGATIPSIGLLQILGKIRHEAETPINRPSEGLLSASRVEDIRAGLPVTGADTTPDHLPRQTQLELELRAAQRSDDLQRQRKIAQELVEIAKKRVDIVKKVGPLLAKRKEELQDALDELDRINDEIQSIATAAAEQRARDAEEARRRQEEAAREAREAAAAQLRQDISDTEAQLQNNLARAQLTEKKLADDRKALRALIRFYREQTRNAKLTKSERLSFEAQLLQTRKELQDLNKKDKTSSTGGATVGDFFQSALENFRSFGSNVAARGGVLSLQDERAAFAFEALRRLKGGKGLDVGLGGQVVGAAVGTGASLDTVVKNQSQIGQATLAEQRRTNVLLGKIAASGANIGVGRGGKGEPPKTPHYAFAAAAAEGIALTGV